MKLVIAVTLLSLSLFCIWAFYPMETSVEERPAARREESPTAAHAKASQEVVAHSPPEKSDAQKKIAEMTKRTDFLGNLAAILVTEEVQEGMVNKTMIRLEDTYQPLFSKWGITNADRKAVLEIIRAREARIISIRITAQKEGRDAVLKSIKVIESERAGYAHEINELLGPEKMRELVQLDKMVQAEAIAGLKASLKN